MASRNLLSVDFEVFGTVQGVFFRKFTKDTAKSRNCVGWVMNTREGTVKGVVQGEANNVAYMKNWLKNEGSPSSKITDCTFKNERQISSLDFSDFKVEH
ncbi:acylphosphatase-1-like [Pomacea canaliculata]|uniref:acylphosphatase-1-like n=1 Tax=Pomacea canaliculata TaxID=400727 RepID=UPI000D727B33|nr:acylphosphatase-1-like [Pomacea canaliculata]